jgi:hypothetical protein
MLKNSTKNKGLNKYFTGTCGFETLFVFYFFCVFICITYSTCGLGKYEIGTLVSFSIKKLTIGHVPTLESRHVM